MEAIDASVSSGMLQASAAFLSPCTPACRGNTPLGMASLHHLQTSRSSPALVTGWMSKAGVTLLLGLSRSSLQTQRNHAWEEGTQQSLLYPTELHFVGNRPPWLILVGWGKTYLFSQAERLRSRERIGPDIGHTAGHWQDLLAGF